MKKYALLLLIFICAGCTKSQVLTCNKAQADTGFGMEENIVVEFNPLNKQNLTMDLKFILNEEYMEHIDVINNNIDEITDVYANKKGIQISNLEENNNIIVNVIVDYSLLDEQIDNDILKIGSYKTGDIDSLKSNMETKGYSCNISDK